MRRMRKGFGKKHTGMDPEEKERSAADRQAQRLYRCLTEVEDALILEAGGPIFPGERYQETSRKKRAAHLFSFRRRTALVAAAALLLIIGTGAFFLTGRVGKYGSNNAGSAAGGSGSDGGSTFMSYGGPVFPLTLQKEAGEISAARSLTLDFSPWESRWRSNEEEAASRGNLTDEERAELLARYQEWYPEGGYYSTSTNILVTDSYRLTNLSDTDQEVTAVYPFASSLRELPARLPALAVDSREDAAGIAQMYPAEPVTGAAQHDPAKAAAGLARLYPGDYAGGFIGVQQENGISEGTWNLREPECWEDYAALLADGSYQENAFGERESAADIRVTVYRFTDFWGPESSDEIPNPTIRAEFQLDYDKTRILTYGFNQMSRDEKEGRMGQGFSVQQPGDRHAKSSCYLIAVGEDIQALTLQGYATGGWDTEKKVEAGAAIERYETNLDAVLRDVTAILWESVTETELVSYYGGAIGEILDYETYHALFTDFLLHYGTLSPDGTDRYDNGMLEELDVINTERVCYLALPLLIPAKETVTLTASFQKAASFDFACAETQNRGIYGYDAVTGLGSNLLFSSQNATLLDRGQIQIVRQNFGFDLEKGINQVELDLAQEHYYLEVRRKNEG